MHAYGFTYPSETMEEGSVEENASRENTEVHDRSNRRGFNSSAYGAHARIIHILGRSETSERDGPDTKKYME